MKIVVFVDCQEDFFRGSLANKNAVDIIPALVERAEQAYEDKELMIFTQDTHKEDYLTTLEGQKLQIQHTIYETEGWKIIPELSDYAKLCVYKYTFGSFDLIDRIKSLITAMGENVEIEVCGVIASICVLANCILLRAAFPNIKIVVNSKLIADLNEENKQAAIACLKAQQIDIVE